MQSFSNLVKNATQQGRKHMKYEPWNLRIGKEEYLKKRKYQSSYILKFDGASKRSPRVVGMRGVLFNHDEKKEI